MDNADARDSVLEQLRVELPQGKELSGATILRVDPHSIGALIRFSWRSYPHVCGLPIDLSDLTREYLYGTPVKSTSEWMREFPTNLMVHLDTGAVYVSKRRLVSDYIELDDRDVWPRDNGFSEMIVEPDDVDVRSVQIDFVPQVGERQVCLSVSGRMIESDIAAVEVNLVAAGVPDIALADALRMAAHGMADLGAERVQTVFDRRTILEVLGFYRSGAFWEVETTFLGEDFSRARELVGRMDK